MARSKQGEYFGGGEDRVIDHTDMGYAQSYEPAGIFLGRSVRVSLNQTITRNVVLSISQENASTRIILREARQAVTGNAFAKPPGEQAQSTNVLCSLLSEPESHDTRFCVHCTDAAV